MTKLAEMQAQSKALADELNDLALKAAAEGRDFNDEERVVVQRKMAEHEELKLKIKRQKDDNELRKTIMGLPPDFSGDRTWTKSVEENLVTRRGAKALVAPGTVIAPAAFDAQVHDEGRPLRFVQSIIPHASMDGDSAIYFRQTVRDSQAAAHTPGDPKEVSTFTVERKELRPVTIAHITEALNLNDLSDAPSLQQFVESELRLGLVREVDREVLYGNDEATPAELEGLTNTSNVQVQTFDTDIFVTTRKAITKVENELAVASHFVLSPADWEEAELSRDAEERFLFEQAPIDRQNFKLWGLPVVVSPDVTPGTGFVGAFATEARLYVREDTTLRFGTVDDEFQRNQIRALAEGRWGIAWLRPSAFVSIELSGS